MSRRPPLLAAALFILAAAPAAEAIIPSTLGPMQALLMLLPQIMVALAAFLVAMFKPRTYRMFFAYLRAHKGLAAGLVAVAALVLWNPFEFGGAASAEQVGAEWALFRGGPARNGRVPGARGPVEPPFPAWAFGADGVSAIDSSPAVVGNRIYFGMSKQTPFASSGSICAVDTATGDLAWRWTGKGELDSELRPVFSSPAVSVEEGRARYLVTGEGYHTDKNCRITCLDLEPTRKGGAPKLAWSVATTSHVESSACIADGRVYIGAGDDGLWCLDLKTGAIVWRIEGGPWYLVEGSKLEVGETVTLTGRARRDWPQGDVGFGAPVLDMAGKGRTVTGKVALVDGRERIEVDRYYPDVESSPVVAGGRLLFGSGIGGQALICVDAATGRELWKAPTPNPAFGSPTVVGDRVILGGGNGNFVTSDPSPSGFLLCVALADGKELWRRPAGDTILGAAAAEAGRVYAASRDGSVYVVNVADGKQVGVYPTGGTLVCSPAVTGDSIYVTADSGKAFCLDRERLRLRWSMNVAPGQRLLSSPAVAAGRLFVGTNARGLVCLAERGARERKIVPWSGPGGGPDRGGVADDLGPPPVDGDFADLRFEEPGLTGPLIACGSRIYAGKAEGIVAVDARVVWESPGTAVELAADEAHVYAVDGRHLRALRARDGSEAWRVESKGDILGTAGGRVYCATGCLDAKTGKELWSFGVRELSGTPALAHNLVIVAEKGAPRLSALSDGTGAPVWTTPLAEPPTGPPTVLRDLVFTAGSGFLQAHRLSDGSLAWRRKLEAGPVSHITASGDHLAFATSAGQIAVLKAADGAEAETLRVGKGARAPAMHGNLLIFASENRVGAYDLSASEWTWKFREQAGLGLPSGGPVVCRSAVWVSGLKRGVVAMGKPR